MEKLENKDTAPGDEAMTWAEVVKGSGKNE